eukprot:5847267-Prymnesium_polylepis.1
MRSFWPLYVVMIEILDAGMPCAVRREEVAPHGPNGHVRAGGGAGGRGGRGRGGRGKAWGAGLGPRAIL